MKTSHLVAGLAIGVFAVGALGPHASEWAGHAAATGVTDSAKGAATAAVTGAGDVCAGGNAYFCAIVPVNPAGDAANLAGVRARTGWTTVTSQGPAEPYPPADGPLRALPSAAPAAPAPPPASPRPDPGDGGSDLPQLGEAPTGGILSHLPVVGKALTEGLKALPSGAEGG